MKKPNGERERERIIGGDYEMEGKGNYSVFVKYDS